MAQYNRYVTVNHLTYDQFRNATLGNGYNVDRAYGNQCWDYCALLYWQYNLTLVTKVGGGTAYDCWNVSRAANSKYPFISVTGVTNIRRGDIIITKSPQSRTGHICIADENYRTSGDKTRLWCVGQNQRGNSSLPVTRDNISIRYFVGIFRNRTWTNTPPTPPPTPPTPPEPTPAGETVYNNSKYPWVLYNFNKNKGKRNG